MTTDTAGDFRLFAARTSEAQAILTLVTLWPARKYEQKPVDLVVDFTDSNETVGYLQSDSTPNFDSEALAKLLDCRQQLQS